MSWDYIIIGAGSAGCAAAHELVKSDRRPKVLVLEAGGSDRSPLIKIPAGVLRACAVYDWGYRTQPDPTRDGASDSLIRGRVLGGSSSINGMLYVRGAAGDFDRWAQQCGNAGGWSAQEILPLFRELENSDQPGPFRGDMGPLYINTVKRPHEITEAFIKSAGAAGHSFIEDYNGASQEGVSYMQRTLRRGLRCSAADAFLKPLLRHGNLKLLLNSLVERIEVSNGRANAVSFVHRGKRHREMARDIILCAGAINSPKLLMLSGIGDAQDLRRHQIDVVQDLPSVGSNLREHPFVRMVYRSVIPTYNLTEGWGQRLSFLMKYLRYREGPIRGAYESLVFLKTGSSEPLADVLLYFAPIGYLGKLDRGALAPFPALMIGVAKMRPLSSGRICLASSDPSDAPLIQYNLLAHQADVETLMRGIAAARQIMRTAPIAGLIESEISPGTAIEGERALERYIRTHTEVSLHPLGTCRMGIDESAVVGPDLRVRGTENLWIADASVMPDHLGANLNAVCIMIGMKLGRQLAERQ